MERVFVRAATAIIDVFHFQDLIVREVAALEAKAINLAALADGAVAVAADSSAGGDAPSGNADADADDSDDSDDDEDGVVRVGGGDGGQNIGADGVPRPGRNRKGLSVVDSLSKVVLPILGRLLSSQSASGVATGARKSDEDNVALKPFASLAYVKVLLLLPVSMFDVLFPRFLLRACAALKSRLQSERDAAKQTLVQISATVGHLHLKTILDEARRTLQSGFAVHVLGHVYHALLLGAASHLVPAVSGPVPVAHAGGDDDVQLADVSAGSAVLIDCLPLLLEVVMEDVLGSVAESRQSDSGYNPKVWFVAVGVRVSCVFRECFVRVAVCLRFVGGCVRCVLPGSSLARGLIVVAGVK